MGPLSQQSSKVIILCPLGSPGPGQPWQTEPPKSREEDGWVGGAVAVSAMLWDVGPRCHHATGRGSGDLVVASDRAALC